MSKSKSNHKRDSSKNENDFEAEDERIRQGDHCQRKCLILCASPPPFRVAIFPFIVLLLIFVVVFVLLFWDIPGYCASDPTRPKYPPRPCVPAYVFDQATNASRRVPCYIAPYQCQVYDEVNNALATSTCNYACEPTYLFDQGTNSTVLTCPLPCTPTSTFDPVLNATVYTTCPANPFPCSVYDPVLKVNRLTACPVNDTTRYYPCVPNTRWDPFVGRMVTTTCPQDDHMCAYLTVAGVPVAVWALFLIVVTAGWAVIGLIVTFIWLIFRLVSGKYGMMWEYLKPLSYPWILLSWDLLFFISYNRFLYYADRLVIEVCRAIAVVVLILGVTYIIASILSTYASRSLASAARARALKFRYKARLVDLVIKNDAISMDNAYTKSLNNLDSHIENKKAARATSDKVRAAKVGKNDEESSIEMKEEMPVYTTAYLSERDLTNSFRAIDSNRNGKVSKTELVAYAGLKEEYLADDLWSIFSSEPDGEIFVPEFISGIRNVERSLGDTINELEDRRFIAGITNTFIVVGFLIIGVTIALEAIGLHISVLVAAVALAAIAVALLVSGLVGRYMSSFFFLLFAHPYYRGDTITVVGGESVLVTKITLLNTYGFAKDGRWVMFDNATLASSRIDNLSRSKECVFTFTTSVHPETPKSVLADWERTILAYIKRNPQDWRDFTFIINSVTADNKLNIEMNAYARGAKWSDAASFNHKRADLWQLIHQSASQLGVYSKPTVTEVALVHIETAQNTGVRIPKEDEKELDYSDNEAQIAMAARSGKAKKSPKTDLSSRK